MGFNVGLIVGVLMGAITHVCPVMGKIFASKGVFGLLIILAVLKAGVNGFNIILVVAGMLVGVFGVSVIMSSTEEKEEAKNK